MLTDRDIAMAVYLRGQPLSQISAESTMSREVYSLKPSDSPHQAALVMRLHQIRRLPIVDDNGTLVGMLTLSDLARSTEPGPGGPIGPSEVSDTLRTIYAPRQIAANNVIA
jgi:CBS domain-containing protein